MSNLERLSHLTLANFNASGNPKAEFVSPQEAAGLRDALEASENFARTLTFVCEHNADGALGFVVNRPTAMSLAASGHSPVMIASLASTHTTSRNRTSLGPAPIR